LVNVKWKVINNYYCFTTTKFSGLLYWFIYQKNVLLYFLWVIQVKLSNVFWLAKGLLYWQEGRYCFQGFLTPALKSYDICYLNKAVDSWFNFLFALKYISFIPWKWNRNNGYSSQWNFLPHMCSGSSCTIVKGWRYAVFLHCTKYNHHQCSQHDHIY